MLRRMKRDLVHHARLAVAAFVLVAGCGSSDGDDIRSFLDRMLAQQFVSETSHLITLQTYRTEDPQSEQRVVDNLASARGYLMGLAEEFNRGQRTLKLEPFEWRRAGPSQTQWVFGFRLGSGPKRVEILAHGAPRQCGLAAFRAACRNAQPPRRGPALPGGPRGGG